MLDISRRQYIALFFPSDYAIITINIGRFIEMSNNCGNGELF